MAHRLLRYYEADGWERSDFPIICESCLGDNSQFLNLSKSTAYSQRRRPPHDAPWIRPWMPETQKCKKMENQESFLKQRIPNAKEHLEKRQKENREAELTKLMFDSLTREVLDDLSMTDLDDLGLVVGDNLKEIIKKIDSLTTTSTSPSTDVMSDAEN